MLDYYYNRKEENLKLIRFYFIKERDSQMFLLMSIVFVAGHLLTVFEHVNKVNKVATELRTNFLYGAGFYAYANYNF